MDLPYRIAVLCYLYDAEGRVLLLHRRRDPNAGMYSPIGGKLETGTGESPHACAVREIQEEAGLDLVESDLHLTGMVAETAYAGHAHWLLFLFEVRRTVGHDEIAAMDFDEGTLEWVPADEVESRAIPDTDRTILWPLVRDHRRGFFAVDVDCRTEPFSWTVQESHRVGT